MSLLKIRNSGETIMPGNVYCIGKNYADHIKEFDTPEKPAEIPDTPVVFLKPATAVTCGDTVVLIPSVNGKPISENLQNEVELVIVIGKDGNNIPEPDAVEYVFGYAAGIDFTLRDIQSEAKKKGLPWAIAKGFRTSSPVSEVVPKEEIRDVNNLDISLLVNNEQRQSGNTKMMIFSIPYIIHYLSCIFGLRKNDLIFTGTPAGIAKLNSGDKITAEIQDIGKINVLTG